MCRCSLSTADQNPAPVCRPLRMSSRSLYHLQFLLLLPYVLFFSLFMISTGWDTLPNGRVSAFYSRVRQGRRVFKTFSASPRLNYLQSGHLPRSVNSIDSGLNFE